MNSLVSIKNRLLFFPSPLVGEGGALERSDRRRMRGNVETRRCSAIIYPSPELLRFAQVAHPLPQGERERHKFAFTRSLLNGVILLFHTNLRSFRLKTFRISMYWLSFESSTQRFVEPPHGINRAGPAFKEGKHPTCTPYRSTVPDLI